MQVWHKSNLLMFEVRVLVMCLFLSKSFQMNWNYEKDEKNKSAAGKNLVSFMDVFTRTLSTLTWKLLALADDILSLYTL